jgi:phosphatidylserine/phosphatidylglycerophosphate/cardiolipin synthase-like enzyme
MTTKSLCQSHQTRKAIKNCFDIRRHPSRVRIISFQVRDVPFDDEVGANTLQRKVAGLLNAGSKVVILIGEDPKKLSDPQKEFFRRLIDLQAKVFYNKRVHAKVTLVEGTKEKLLVLGSANMTKRGMYHNIEVNVAINNSTSAGLDAYDEISGYVDEVLGRASTTPLDNLLE